MREADRNTWSAKPGHFAAGPLRSRGCDLRAESRDLHGLVENVQLWQQQEQDMLEQIGSLSRRTDKVSVDLSAELWQAVRRRAETT